MQWQGGTDNNDNNYNSIQSCFNWGDANTKNTYFGVLSAVNMHIKHCQCIFPDYLRLLRNCSIMQRRIWGEKGISIVLCGTAQAGLWDRLPSGLFICWIYPGTSVHYAIYHTLLWAYLDPMDKRNILNRKEREETCKNPKMPSSLHINTLLLVLSSRLFVLEVQSDRHKVCLGKKDLYLE